MSISADLIRELLARTEGPKLDFKRQDYDWDNDGNVELAKDLMAMGNVLSVGAEPSYILIGVDEAADRTGMVVGIPATSHQDDAALHQRVSALLNRTPDFSYSAVEADGLSVGVFEIRPGGRPFYALRERGRLRRYEALHRNGSATELASPDQILSWAHEDDLVQHQLHSLELERVRSELAIRVAVRQTGFDGSGDTFKIRLTVTNQGLRPVVFATARYEARFTEEAAALLHRAPGATFDDIGAITGNAGLEWTGGVLMMGQTEHLHVRLEKGGVHRHVERFGLSLPGWDSSWFNLVAFFDVRSGDRQETIEFSINTRRPSLPT